MFYTELWHTWSEVMPRASPQQRALIQALWKTGLHNNAAIARRVCVDEKTVATWAKRCVIKEKSRSGRPRVLSKRQQMSVVQLARKHNRYSSTKLAPMVAKLAHHPVSSSTIRGVLHAQGLYWLPEEQEKEGLDDDHKKARKKWARQHQKRQWSNVMWCDEKCWNLYPSKVYVRRGRKERVPQVVKKHAIKLTCWGAFSAWGYSQLFLFKGEMTKKLFKDAIEKKLIPYTRQHGIGRCWLQMDNSGIHHMNEVFQLFEDNNIKPLWQPALSPDLNPMENVWANPCCCCQQPWPSYPSTSQAEHQRGME
jgi:transposase